MHLSLVPPAGPASESLETKSVALQRKRRHVPAVLTLTPTPQCGDDDLDSRAGHYMGALHVGEFSTSFNDGHRLGMIAYILNVGNVELHLPFLPNERPSLPAHRYHIPPVVWSVENPKARLARNRQKGSTQALFVTRFASALQYSTQSVKMHRDFLDWWERDCLIPALATVPKELQVNTRFLRGEYDEDGKVKPRKRPEPDRVALWSRYLKEQEVARATS